MTGHPEPFSSGPGLGRSIGHSLAGTIGARVVGAAGGLLAARLLGPDLRGEYALAFLLASVASLLLTCGLQFWVITGVASHAAALPLKKVIVRHGVAVLVASSLLGVVSVSWLQHRWQIGGWTVVGMVAYTWLTAVSMLVIAAPNGARDMRTVGLAASLGALAFTSIVGLLYLMGQPSVPLMMVAASAGSGVTLLVAYPSFRHLANCVPTNGIAQTGLTEWRRAIRSFIGAGLGEVALLGMLRVDFILLGALGSLRDVGLYAAATALTELLWVVPDATAQVALPLAAERDGMHAIPRIFRTTVAVSVALGLGMSAVASLVVPLVFGRSYGNAASAVPLLALAAVLGGGWKVLAGDVAARGRPAVRLQTALLGLGGMLAADLLLIPRWGIVGASGGAAVGYFFAMSSMAFLWRRLPETSARDLCSFRRTDLPVALLLSRVREGVFQK